MTSVTLNDPGAKGTNVRWKAGPTRLVSTLQLVDRPCALGWTGRDDGGSGDPPVALWATTGRAAASMEESFDGAVAKLFRKRLQRQLDETTAKGLQALKAAAERSTQA
jgi:hypothetical protein